MIRKEVFPLSHQFKEHSSCGSFTSIAQVGLEVLTETDKTKITTLLFTLQALSGRELRLDIVGGTDQGPLI